MNNICLNRDNLEKKLISLISKILVVEYLEHYLLKSDNLKDLGMNSVKLIMLIIEIEKEFLIEFDDESLVFLNFYSYNTLKDYIVNKTMSKEE